MRIALDATYSIDPHPSGIAVYSLELMRGLAAMNPDDRFLHCYRTKQWVRAPQPLLPNTSNRLLLPPLPTFRADIFHALNQRVDRRNARTVISTFHDLFVMTGEYSSPEFRARFTTQAKLAAHNSDLIIAISEFTAEQVRNLLNVEASRIRVVPHGVRQSPSRDVVSRDHTVLFVGALQMRKNIARLVRAFESLPNDWRLVLAGSPNGYGAAQILQQIGESKARDRIEVRGYVTGAELDRLYNSASIFAFPSLDEGFGLPVLEAMAHGLPVVTSSNSALAEVAGNAALLVNPYQDDQLAEALQRFVNEPDLRNQFSALGRSRSQNYPWEQTCRATYAVYLESSSTEILSARRNF